jgi:hypothetical protein
LLRWPAIAGSSRSSLTRRILVGLSASEAAAQSAIVELATLHRWRCFHPFDSRRSAGGWPDLALVRDRFLVAELKREGEKPRADQVEWLNALAQAGVETYLWTLADLPEIQRVLSRSWSFTRYASEVVIGGAWSTGPALTAPGSDEIFTPGSAWVPGHGRRDAPEGARKGQS